MSGRGDVKASDNSASDLENAYVLGSGGLRQSMCC